MDEDKVPLIALEGLSKGYVHRNTRIDILRHLDFSIQEGDAIAVVGASGIGKSTLLHIIGTLDRPDAGLLLYQGQNIFTKTDMQLATFRNKTIGFMFQFHHLLPEFTALENTMMPALIAGDPPPKAMGAAQSVLSRIGLENRLSHRVGDLSGGEQQRVALARALVMKPKILLADEPTGNLDAQNSQQVHHLLMELNQELSMTLLVVTHNPLLAQLMSKRVTLVDGKIESV